MAKLTDIQIKAWIKNGEYFEGRSDGDGLYISYRENFAIPIWRFRYKLNNHQLKLVGLNYGLEVRIRVDLTTRLRVVPF